MTTFNERYQVFDKYMQNLTISIFEYLDNILTRITNMWSNKIMYKIVRIKNGEFQKLDIDKTFYTIKDGTEIIMDIIKLLKVGKCKMVIEYCLVDDSDNEVPKTRMKYDYRQN